MDIEQLMQQAQQFQERLGAAKEELADRRATASVGGGMVRVTVNGHFEVLKLEIEPEVIDPDDPGMLQDLVIAGVNDALRQVRELIQGEMGKLTGGLNIPGLF